MVVTLSAVVCAYLQYFDLPRALQSWKPHTVQLPEVRSCSLKAVGSEFGLDAASRVSMACLPVRWLVHVPLLSEG